MHTVKTDIFHLGNARNVLRKALAFCGLVSILLTAACSPTSSDTSKIETPKFSDDSAQESRDGVQVLPETLPETKPELKPAAKIDDTIPEAQEITPAALPNVNTPNVNTLSTSETIPANNSTAKPTLQNSTSNAGGGTTAEATLSDSPAGKAKAEARSLADRLTGNYVWATMPTFVDSYKDSSGQIHEHFLVSSGDSKELKDLLAKMRDELVAGHRPQIEIKEQGTCGNTEEQKEASTKSCDTSAPICVSLEATKDLRPLIMREFARQHCADEALVQQVQKYYELPTVKNFKVVSNIASTFNRVRLNLVYLQAALTTGVMPNAGAYAQKIDTQEDICTLITQGANLAQRLQDLVASSGELTATLSGMKSFCDNNSLDRQGLLQTLPKAIKIYDQQAQEFSKKSGMIVLDFSKHLWPHKTRDSVE